MDSGKPVIHRPHDNTLGAAFMVLSVLMFTIEAAVARSLAGSVPLAYLLATRGLSQLLLPMPWLFRLGIGKVLNSSGRKLQIVRGCLTIGSFSTFYYAASHLPLALSTVISFSTILWVVLLAAPLLNETVGPARWGSALVGFCGILVATRPAWGGESAAILAGVVAATFVAMIVLIVRRLAGTEHSAVIMFYSGLCTSIAFVPFALAAWQPISSESAWKLLLLVPCGPLGQLCQFKAYRVGEASAVTPVQYVRYLIALLIGWLAFSEIPDRWNIGGALLVVGAALWLTWIESRRVQNTAISQLSLEREAR